LDSHLPKIGSPFGPLSTVFGSPCDCGTVEFVCPLLIGEQKAFDSLWQVYNFWALE